MVEVVPAVGPAVGPVGPVVVAAEAAVAPPTTCPRSWGKDCDGSRGPWNIPPSVPSPSARPHAEVLACVPSLDASRP
jgi:hypothetical protein